MMQINQEIIEDLSDWDLLCYFLPPGWREKARETGALTRARGIADAESLLRLLLMHLANGCSLIETAVRARESGLGTVSSVALWKRLQKAEEWLRWMAAEVRAKGDPSLPAIGRRTRAVDASTVSEPGSTGTNWRVHYVVNLMDLQCDFFELTDWSGGETWRRIPVKEGDVLLGDRIYSTPRSVAHVVDGKGDVLVRLNPHSLPLYHSDGKRLSVLGRVRELRVGEVGDWPAYVLHPEGHWIAGRLIALKRSREATRRVRKQLQQRASHKQKNVSPASWKAAAYMLAWTSLLEEYPAEDLLECYRFRWQIELVFKRLKSIMGLGHLPKKDPASARAWLHGKLLVGLLVERIIGEASAFSPWGYRLVSPAKPLAGNRVRLS